MHTFSQSSISFFRFCHSQEPLTDWIFFPLLSYLFVSQFIVLFLEFNKYIKSRVHSKNVFYRFWTIDVSGFFLTKKFILTKNIFFFKIINTSINTGSFFSSFGCFKSTFLSPELSTTCNTLSHTLSLEWKLIKMC